MEKSVGRRNYTHECPEKGRREKTFKALNVNVLEHRRESGA